MFYAPPQCHYTVVFNRDPWLARCADSNPADCVDFLRREGVTHVYISWSEVNRLRGTYGFSDVVTPEWAARLTDGGLKLIAEQKSPTGAAVTQLFQVSR